jgi:hypothetical protein
MTSGRVEASGSNKGGNRTRCETGASFAWRRLRRLESLTAVPQEDTHLVRLIGISKAIVPVRLLVRS